MGWETMELVTLLTVTVEAAAALVVLSPPLAGGPLTADPPALRGRDGGADAGAESAEQHGVDAQNGRARERSGLV
jgi:hypothetical protein